jgi:hypothetical protein
LYFSETVERIIEAEKWEEYYMNGEVYNYILLFVNHRKRIRITWLIHIANASYFEFIHFLFGVQCCNKLTLGNKKTVFIKKQL